jgi:hypothetical protein
MRTYLQRSLLWAGPPLFNPEQGHIMLPSPILALTDKLQFEDLGGGRRAAAENGRIYQTFDMGKKLGVSRIRATACLAKMTYPFAWRDFSDTETAEKWLNNLRVRGLPKQAKKKGEAA